MKTVLLAMILSWDSAGYYGRGLDVSVLEYNNYESCNQMSNMLGIMDVMHPNRSTIETDHQNFCFNYESTNDPMMESWDLAIQVAIVNANSRPIDRNFIRGYTNYSTCKEHEDMINSIRFANNSGVVVDAACVSNYVPE